VAQVAPALIAAAPLAYFAGGASDDATDGERVLGAGLFVLVAWFPLALAVGIARRAVAPGITRSLALLLGAEALLGVARHLGSHATIHGDAPWTLYWATCAVAWLWLSRRLARRGSARPHPRARRGTGLRFTRT